MTLADGTTFRVNLEPMAGMADSGILDEDVTDLLVATGEAARDRGIGVLVTVDEVQYLIAEELAALVVAIHRTTQLDLPVVFVDAGLPQVPGLAGEARSYAERLFEFPEVGALDAEDARAALRVPADEAGINISEQALDEGEIVVARNGEIVAWNGS